MKPLLQILFLATMLICLLLWCPYLSAADLDIWYKLPGATYWQQCISYDNSTGLGPVEKYIPDGAIIAVREQETWSLTVLTRGR